MKTQNKINSSLYCLGFVRREENEGVSPLFVEVTIRGDKTKWVGWNALSTFFPDNVLKSSENIPVETAQTGRGKLFISLSSLESLLAFLYFTYPNEAKIPLSRFKEMSFLSLFLGYQENTAIAYTKKPQSFSRI